MEYICQENNKDVFHLGWGNERMTDWKEHGVRIVRLWGIATLRKTPGMTRAAAITHAGTGASKLWAGTVTVRSPRLAPPPIIWGAGDDPLCHPRSRALPLGRASGIRGRSRAGDFIYVPPFVPHQEMNARPDEPSQEVVGAAARDPIVVNLDIVSPEPAAGYRRSGSRTLFTHRVSVQTGEGCFNLGHPGSGVVREDLMDLLIEKESTRVMTRSPDSLVSSAAEQSATDKRRQSLHLSAGRERICGPQQK